MKDFKALPALRVHGARPATSMHTAARAALPSSPRGGREGEKGAMIRTNQNSATGVFVCVVQW